MISKILILAFILAMIISGVIGKIIFYHFKKFSLASDAFARKIIKMFISGTVGLSLLALLFLLLAIL